MATCDVQRAGAEGLVERRIVVSGCVRIRPVCHGSSRRFDNQAAQRSISCPIFQASLWFGDAWW